MHSHLARYASQLFVGIVEPEFSDSARANEAKPYAWLVGASQAALKASAHLREVSSSTSRWESESGDARTGRQVSK